MAARNAITVRFPSVLLSRARASTTDRESLNDLVIEAVEREIRRRQGLLAYAAIRRLREDIKTRAGSQPDSSPLIRELRDGVARGR
jgi:hypothetical protein